LRRNYTSKFLFKAVDGL